MVGVIEYTSALEAVDEVGALAGRDLVVEVGIRSWLWDGYATTFDGQASPSARFCADLTAK